MDEGGAVGYRNSADAEDKSPLVAKPGQRVRAVRASERWVLAQNGLWLPRQFLGGVGGEDGLELPLRATYRRVMAHNEVSLPCHRRHHHEQQQRHHHHHHAEPVLYMDWRWPGL